MNIAAIFAGGVGSRMQSKDKPKQFLEIHGKPIIIHTLDHFEQHEEIDAIVVACVEAWIPHLEGLIARFGLRKVKRIVPGGESGQASIYRALCAAEEVAAGGESIVLIHDGVRPLINAKLISDNIAGTRRHGSAITSVPAKETVLLVRHDGGIAEIPDRTHSALARAPQSFYLSKILAYARRAIDEGRTDFVDSCSLARHYGAELYLVEGPSENIKITTPDDFYIMRAILDIREDRQVYMPED